MLQLVRVPSAEPTSPVSASRTTVVVELLDARARVTIEPGVGAAKLTGVLTALGCGAPRDPAGVEVFVRLEPIDLRWSFDHLVGLVAERLGRDARSPALPLSIYLLRLRSHHVFDERDEPSERRNLVIFQRVRIEVHDIVSNASDRVQLLYEDLLIDGELQFRPALRSLEQTLVLAEIEIRHVLNEPLCIAGILRRL
ncbi:MAG TPA: hypothetical protein VHE35_07245 [Kofleriaceae bacterium]|nr:hypothetical protein [Kofleriaceae bacterium]